MWKNFSTLLSEGATTALRPVRAPMTSEVILKSVKYVGALRLMAYRITWVLLLSELIFQVEQDAFSPRHRLTYIVKWAEFSLSYCCEICKWWHYNCCEMMTLKICSKNFTFLI